MLVFVAIDEMGAHTSSSPITQGKVLLSPKLMQPNTGTEMRNPDLPRLRYSHLEASRDALSRAGRPLVGAIFTVLKKMTSRDGSETKTRGTVPEIYNALCRWSDIGNDLR